MMETTSDVSTTVYGVTLSLSLPLPLPLLSFASLSLNSKAVLFLKGECKTFLNQSSVLHY